MLFRYAVRENSKEAVVSDGDPSDKLDQILLTSSTFVTGKMALSSPPKSQDDADLMDLRPAKLRENDISVSERRARVSLCSRPTRSEDS